MGSYLSAASALGLQFKLVPHDQHPPDGRGRGAFKEAWDPSKTIRISDFPQLEKLAWQLKDTTELTPQEALDLYERNWRHIDPRSLSLEELILIRSIFAIAGREVHFV